MCALEQVIMASAMSFKLFFLLVALMTLHNSLAQDAQDGNVELSSGLPTTIGGFKAAAGAQKDAALAKPAKSSNAKPTAARQVASAEPTAADVAAATSAAKTAAAPGPQVVRKPL